LRVYSFGAWLGVAHLRIGKHGSVSKNTRHHFHMHYNILKSRLKSSISGKAISIQQSYSKHRKRLPYSVARRVVAP
ncbi:hypothetical protein, partial [Tardiphaga sp.]|uniref:hypothetical protein n=1 Tax=Tardiphaga sp. TaxID=1926292 RepID=UPI00352A8FAE